MKIGCNKNSKRCVKTNKCCISNLFEMLIYFKKICDDNSISYILYAGTLLGAIRGNKIIDTDTDIDIMMDKKNYDKISKTLTENNTFIFKENQAGNSLSRLFYSNLNKLHIDIWIVEFDKITNDFKLNYDNKKYWFSSRFLNETINENIFDISFKIPKDYDTLLIRLYGKDYIIEKPGFKGNYQIDKHYD